jgi:hypothetical protein
MIRLAILSFSCCVLLFSISTEALDPSWVSGPYSWNQGQGPKKLELVSTHICVLNKVAGDFDGGGEEVKIYQANGYWYISGKSQQSGVGGQSYCFAREKFLANGSARWTSDDGIWKSATSGKKCYSGQGDAWWGDATTILNGINGKLRGSGDKAFINQSNGSFTPSVLRVETCKYDSSGGYIKAYAHSFFTGTPHSGNKLAQYWGNEYVADSGSHCTIPNSVNGEGYQDVAMAPANDAMCHFTYIGGGGNWDGGSEYVMIYPKQEGGIERWFLRAHSGYCGNSRRTIAHARCYKRDQR